MLDLRGSVIALSYIVAAVLFIFGLKRLSSPSTARSGNRIAAIGMALALVATLLLVLVSAAAGVRPSR